MHINNFYQKNSNLSNVFETIWKNGEISRIEISRRLDLYRSTVSNIINVLLENKVIFEGERGAATEKGGRKPVFLTLNKNYGCIIGIEIQPDNYYVSVVSFDGVEFLNYTNETPFNEALLKNPQEHFIYIVDKIIEEIIPKMKDVKMPVLGMSIGIPGIIDIDRGIVVRSDPFSLTDFSYAKSLANRYGVPVFFENDAKCCAWTQCAKNSQVTKKDFLCVLARSHNSDSKFPSANTYKNGIGVGLSFALNGQIVNGHNYAVGEYISRSWNETDPGQTGLSEEIVSTIVSEDESYRQWVIDLFSTLTITVPLLEPCSVFLHGQPESRKQFIFDVIHKDVSKFEAVMERYNTKLVIMDEDNFEIARGAAFMFIQKLFEIPSIAYEESYSHIDWDDLFVIQQRGLNQIHAAK